MARTVAPGERVLVRLALLPGMKAKDEPSPEEIMRLKLGLRDPAMMQKMLDDARVEQDNKSLNVDQLTAQLWLYPRIRPATIAYVDRTEGKSTGWVNLDVFTPGSPVLQGAIGKIPQYAQEHFRLERVPFYTREPGKDDPEDGSHQMHVAFWEPEEDEETPLRKSEVQRQSRR